MCALVIVVAGMWGRSLRRGRAKTERINRSAEKGPGARNGHDAGVRRPLRGSSSGGKNKKATV